MIYESELVEFEGSIAMLLPQNLLDELGLSIDDEIVFIQQDDGSVIFQPLDKNMKEQLTAAKEGMDNYFNALSTLAEEKEIEATVKVAKDIIRRYESTFEELDDGED